MPLELHPATPADLPRIVAIEIASFAPSPLTPLLFPNGHTPASTAAYIAQLEAEWTANPTTKILKVIDTERGGETIAFVKWYVYVGADVQYIKTEPGEQLQVLGSRQGAADAFFGSLVRIRAGLMGREEHCFLSTMCTDPQHQRRGAGLMLINWGLEVAGRHGVPAFTEASIEGIPAYQKAGFRQIGVFELDMGKFGGKGIRTNTQMVWYPDGYAGPINI